MTRLLARTAACCAAFVALVGSGCSTPSEERIIGRSALGEVSCDDLARFAGSLAAKRVDLLTEDGRATEDLVRSFVLREALAEEAIEQQASTDERLAQQVEEAEAGWLRRQWEAVLAPSRSFSDDEIEAYYAAHRDAFRHDEQISTRFLLIRREDEDEAQSFLERLRERALEGESFAELARRYSEAENAPRGGAVATSPRGALLAAYEEVAWGLEPGEISQPVELPDGWALIQLRDRYPARELSVAEARSAIEKRLAREAREARRAEALDEARRSWPVEIDWERALRADLSPEDRIGAIGATALSLSTLGLEHRPPFLRSAVEDAVEDRLMLLLGKQRFGDWRHDPLGAEKRRSQLASWAKRARLLDRLEGVLPPEEVEEARQRFRSALETPLRRSFRALVVEGGKGEMRRGLGAAWQERERWMAGERPATERLERWGPLSREQLAAATSPALAEHAFALSLGEISEPLRLESYEVGISRFVPRGYAVLELAAELPRMPKPAAEVRALLLQYVGRQQRRAVEADIQEELLASLALAIDADRLGLCDLSDSVERDDVGGGTPTFGMEQ